MDIGSRVTIDLPVTRRWWQLWKPRERIERHECVVTHVTEAFVLPAWMQAEIDEGRASIVSYEPDGLSEDGNRATITLRRK